MTVLLGLVRVVPIWCWALALALGWGGWQRHRAAAAAQQVAAQEQAKAAAALDAERAARTEEARRTAAVQKVAADARTKAIAATAAATSLRAERDRMRERAEALAVIGGDSCGAGLADGSAAASSPAAVLANVLGGVADAAVQLAAIADERGRAGAACQQSYQAVTGAD